MEKQPDIRIFIACHKPTYVPENPIFYPVQVGTALTEKRLEHMAYRDNEGDNISGKNPDYCELTAQYWILSLTPLSDVSQGLPRDGEWTNPWKTPASVYRAGFRLGRSDTILDGSRVDGAADHEIRSSDRLPRADQYDGIPPVLPVS